MKGAPPCLIACVYGFTNGEHEMFMLLVSNILPANFAACQGPLCTNFSHSGRPLQKPSNGCCVHQYYSRYSYGQLVEINSHSLFSKWFSEVKLELLHSHTFYISYIATVMQCSTPNRVASWSRRCSARSRS